MRAAILSDIHSNLPALHAVLQAIDNLDVSTMWCMGDIIGYGASPNECVEIIRSRCSLVVAGNHDSGVTGGTSIDEFNQHAIDAIVWTRAVLSAGNLEFLKGLPLLLTDGSCTLVHGSPHEPARWHYIFSSGAATWNFPSFATRLCFVGHTHVPVIFGEGNAINQPTSSGRHIINVGSVGQPRDGIPAAAFAVYDSETGLTDIFRVPYAIEEAATAIREAGLPESLAHRLFQGT